MTERFVLLAPPSSNTKTSILTEATNAPFRDPYSPVLATPVADSWNHNTTTISYSNTYSTTSLWRLNTGQASSPGLPTQVTNFSHPNIIPSLHHHCTSCCHSSIHFAIHIQPYNTPFHITKHSPKPLQHTYQLFSWTGSVSTISATIQLPKPTICLLLSSSIFPNHMLQHTTLTLLPTSLSTPSTWQIHHACLIQSPQQRPP
jgi:hypothetical protein